MFSKRTRREEPGLFLRFLLCDFLLGGLLFRSRRLGRLFLRRFFLGGLFLGRLFGPAENRIPVIGILLVGANS